MKTLWCKNQENPSDGISHAWAPLKLAKSANISKTFFKISFGNHETQNSMLSWNPLKKVPKSSNPKKITYWRNTFPHSNKSKKSIFLLLIR
jgi:hypothetical protein